MKFRSIAVWPKGTLDWEGNISKDDHTTIEEARAVCDMLQKYGMGMEGKVYPVKTMVAEVDANGNEVYQFSSPYQMTALQEKFEVWYKHNYWDFPDNIRKLGGYLHLDVQLAWRAFKEGAKNGST